MNITKIINTQDKQHIKNNPQHNPKNYKTETQLYHKIIKQYKPFAIEHLSTTNQNKTILSIDSTKLPNTPQNKLHFTGYILITKPTAKKHKITTKQTTKIMRKEIKKYNKKKNKTKKNGE